jgi:hypothetical protein
MLTVKREVKSAHVNMCICIFYGIYMIIYSTNFLLLHAHFYTIKYAVDLFVWVTLCSSVYDFCTSDYMFSCHHWVVTFLRLSCGLV